MKKEKDMALIRGIKNGDKKAQEKLYEKYKERVKKYLHSKYPNQQDKEDCVSEILIKIFENIDQYDKKRGKFYTWVIKIANNYMINKARKNERNPIQASLNSVDGSLCFYGTTNDCSNMDLSVNTSFTSSIEPTSFAPPPDEQMENKDALNFISNKVGLQDFHLLNMKYEQGYDYNEMEQEMKVSSSTLSNRVNYVRSKLRKKGE